MTKLQELIEIHKKNRNSYSSDTAYRGVKYDITPANTKEFRGTFCYRGNTYTK